MGNAQKRKFSAKVVNLLYAEDDSPLQYKINRLGGRSKQEKWILQSEVFNELLKVVTAHKRWMESHLGMKADRCYALVRDYLKGVKEVMEEVWGNNERYMFTRDVTLKALIRVLDDLIVDRKLIARLGRTAVAQAVCRNRQALGGVGEGIPCRGFLRALCRERTAGTGAEDPPATA